MYFMERRKKYRTPQGCWVRVRHILMDDGTVWEFVELSVENG